MGNTLQCIEDNFSQAACCGGGGAQKKRLKAKRLDNADTGDENSYNPYTGRQGGSWGLPVLLAEQQWNRGFYQQQQLQMEQQQQYEQQLLAQAQQQQQHLATFPTDYRQLLQHLEQQNELQQQVMYGACMQQQPPFSNVVSEQNVPPLAALFSPTLYGRTNNEGTADLETQEALQRQLMEIRARKTEGQEERTAQAWQRILSAAPPNPSSQAPLEMAQVQGAERMLAIEEDAPLNSEREFWTPRNDAVVAS